MSQFNRALRRKGAMVGMSAAAAFAAVLSMAPAANALSASGTVTAQQAIVTTEPVSLNVDTNCLRVADLDLLDVDIDVARLLYVDIDI
jgi:hypothetical protein